MNLTDKINARLATSGNPLRIPIALKEEVPEEIQVHIVLLSYTGDESGYESGYGQRITSIVKVWLDKEQADAQAQRLTTRRDMAWVVTRTLDQS